MKKLSFISIKINLFLILYCISNLIDNLFFYVLGLEEL
jgi:hypothetical protein